MRKNKIIDRGLLSFIAIIMMLAPSLLTAFLRPNLALAKQLSNRSVSIGSSKAGATDVVYTVSFDVGQDTTPLKGIVVQFCDSSSGPLIGNPCTGPTGFTLTPASLSVPAASQTIGGVAVTNAYAVDTTHSNANTLILTNSTGNAATAGQTVSFVLGTGAGDGVANPSTVGTFYARLLTYSDDSAASGYATNGQTPGAYLDDGGIALSTANQLTTTARVQEHLTFCVGTTTVNDYNTVVSDKCADAFTGSCGTSVDLGILDSTAISTSPVQTAAGTPGFGNGCTGAAMVQTNAVHGVVISYFAEPDQGSGRLKVPGASCAGTQPDNTDQCFNNNADGAPYTAGQGTFTAGQEDFGMTIPGINCNTTSTLAYSCDMTAGTNHLVADSGYIGNDAITYGDTNGYQWQDDGTAAQIASSTSPVDNETAILEFAATPNLVTPTGTYQVTSTYIATATF